MLLLHVLPGQRLLLPWPVQRLLPVLPMLPGQRLLLPMLPMLLPEPVQRLLPVLPMLHVLTMLLLHVLPMLLLHVLPGQRLLLPMLLHVLSMLFLDHGQHRKANQWPRSPIQGYRFSLVFGEWPS
jgi:hypothetical protein